MKLFTKGLLVASMLTGIATSSMAATNEQEFKAFSKILSLSKDVAPGDVSVGVVYDSSNAASQADLDAIKAIVGGGFKGAKHNLTVEAIAAGDVASKGVGKKVLFVTEGLSGATQGEIHSVAKANKILTASTDTSAVEGGNVVLGVDVDGGSVKILMNGGAYNEVGLSFDAAFEFMVQEI